MKIAVFFPGIGYKFEKPLLSKLIDLLKSKNFETIFVDYNNFPSDAKNHLEECKKIAQNQTNEILKSVDWNNYSEIVFVGKSIGTAVATTYAYENKINCTMILLTPIPQTFEVEIKNAISFYGSSDPWITKEEVVAGCKKNSIPFIIYDGANHSLLCDTDKKNEAILMDVVDKVKSFLFKI